MDEAAAGGQVGDDEEDEYTPVAEEIEDETWYDLKIYY